MIKRCHTLEKALKEAETELASLKSAIEKTRKRRKRLMSSDVTVKIDLSKPTRKHRVWNAAYSFNGNGSGLHEM